MVSPCGGRIGWSGWAEAEHGDGTRVGDSRGGRHGDREGGRTSRVRYGSARAATPIQRTEVLALDGRGAGGEGEGRSGQGASLGPRRLGAACGPAGSGRPSGGAVGEQSGRARSDPVWADARL